MSSTATTPRIVSRDEWVAARKQHLQQEREFTHRRDRLSRERRELPWVKIDKTYVFEGAGGPVTLADLFGSRSQLIVYHFMLGPGWEEGCKSCSLVADHFDPMLPHLAARDVSLAVVSRAPLAEIRPFHRRMGWKFPWVSSHGNDFNWDFHVSFDLEELEKGKVYYNYDLRDFPMEEAPGLSVFAKGPDGSVYHTYSTYSRGLDLLMGTYNYLDLVPRGRDEDPEATMSWVRYHDSYPEPASTR